MTTPRPPAQETPQHYIVAYPLHNGTWCVTIMSKDPQDAVMVERIGVAATFEAAVQKIEEMQGREQ